MFSFKAEKAQEKALEEDPTIYQYDELYDDMAAQKDEAKKAKKSESKDSKYIARLLVTADKRKKEYERRVERQVQKERETEGDMYADKEIFVTATYRAKLEEMRKAEEEERREEYLENIGDVTKQRDLGGFYRHLYEQKMGPEKKVAANSVDETKTTAEDVETPSTSTSSPNKANKEKKQRMYRRRKSDDNEDEDENRTDNAVKSHLPSNLDADSDFSIDSSSSDEDDNGGDGKSGKKVEAAEKEEKSAKPTETESDAQQPEHQFAKPNLIDDRDDTSSSSDGEPELKVEVKINIWKKRTVGEAFDAALQRYYERKQQREG